MPAHPHALLRKYPHMAPLDAPIWRGFLANPPEVYDEILYDVAIGGAAAGLADSAHELFPMWANLLRKRIDAVAVVSGVTWIIEVKPIANMEALGQVMAYEWLYRAERPGIGETRKAVVCLRADSDLAGVYAQYNVSVFVASAAVPFAGLASPAPSGSTEQT